MRKDRDIRQDKLDAVQVTILKKQTKKVGGGKRQQASVSERQVFVPRTETRVRRPQNDFI